MPVYELSLSEGYVPNWTVVDAVRELFQNAIDQETTVEDNKMFFSYANGVLQIGNKTSVLEVKSLLLGASTKADDKNTIGQFGEGYKIATLLLLREGKSIIFYNYGAREVWTARLVVSRRYGGARILKFNIDKKFIWQKVPDNNLTIEVSGITPEEYEKIVESNLHLQDSKSATETFKGRVLLDGALKGNIYVNGLYVCHNKELHYGYDIKPAYLKIGRDRSLVDNFSISWVTSSMWGELIDDPRLADLLLKGALDVSHLNYHLVDTSVKKIVDIFIDKYGEMAMPVVNQEELEYANRSGYRGVMVSDSMHKIVTKNMPALPLFKESTKDKLLQWLEAHKHCLSTKAVYQLTKILEEM